MIKENLHELLRKEMSRKEFLATIGFGVASLFGIGTLLKLLGVDSPLGSRHVASGYGSSAYGGTKPL